MVDKQEQPSLSDEIVRKLTRKYVDWHGITESLLKSISNAEIPPLNHCAFLSTIEIARLGAQLSDTNERLDKIEKTLKRLAIKSPR